MLFLGGGGITIDYWWDFEIFPGLQELWRFDTAGASLSEKCDRIKKESANISEFSGEIPGCSKTTITLVGVNGSATALSKVNLLFRGSYTLRSQCCRLWLQRHK